MPLPGDAAFAPEMVYRGVQRRERGRRLQRARRDGERHELLQRLHSCSTPLINIA